MDERGQVYADFDGTAPERDKLRFLTEERQALIIKEEMNLAHAAQYALMELRALQLKEALRNAEGR